MTWDRTVIRAVAWEAKRAANARELAELADALARPAVIVWDHDHDAAATMRRALAAGRGAGTVHLEDDVVLSSRWAPQLSAALAGHDDEVVQFFSTEAGESRPGPYGVFWGQCFYVPACQSDALADYAEANPGPLLDLIVFYYLAATGRGYWLSLPSLVQHQPWASTMGHPSGEYVSPTFQP